MNKQQILDEIRRTAKANGGRALGHREFGNVTGIKEADWSGRYWARWGDAVREAGCQPNEMSVAYSDDVLLAKLAQLARRLGKFPVWSELALARRQDDSFPTEKTYRRFRGKVELVRRLTEYCESHAEFADVVELCKAVELPIADQAITEAADEDDDAAEVETGYVYLALMKVGKEKRYKIGKADIVGARTRQIAVSLPEDLELIHAIVTDDAYGIETYWHKRFAEKRRGGEWFVLTVADVKAFKRRKFM
jgi:hypothetical protein